MSTSAVISSYPKFKVQAILDMFWYQIHPSISTSCLFMSERTMCDPPRSTIDFISDKEMNCFQGNEAEICAITECCVWGCDGTLGE